VRARAKGDLGACGREAHAIVGMSGNFGAMKASAVARSLEAACRCRDKARTYCLVGELSEACETSSDALRNWMRRYLPQTFAAASRSAPDPAPGYCSEGRSVGGAACFVGRPAENMVSDLRGADQFHAPGRTHIYGVIVHGVVGRVGKRKLAGKNPRASTSAWRQSSGDFDRDLDPSHANENWQPVPGAPS
jgi:HPt (histidine-containing phosphotransfer) domain-containing protein